MSKEVEDVQEEDLYAALGVDRGATSERIRAAYLAGVKMHHPDRAGSSSTPTSDARIRSLTHAYSILSSPTSRATYDASLSTLTHLSHSANSARRISAYVDVDSLTMREQDGEVLCSLACRCGDEYVVSAAALERGEREVTCGGCSLVIKIVWEEEQEEGEEGERGKGEGEKNEI